MIKQVQSTRNGRTGKNSCLYCLIIIVFIFTGCAVKTRQPQPDTAGQIKSSIIYSVRYEDHSGIIVDRQKAAPYLTVLQKEFPDALFLEFGWGDLEWYKTDVEKRNSLMGIKALFTSTPSGMFVWSLPKHPEQQYPDDRLRKIHISDTEFEKLTEQINGSFALDSENKIIFEKSNMDKGGEYRIYKARGNYHIFKNCNTWFDRVMKASGINARQ